MYVSDVLKAKGAKVVTIPQSAGIDTAAKALRDGKFGALPAVDSAGKMVGIISERDIIRIVGELGAKGLGLRVQDIMTKSLRTSRATNTIEEVMEQMARFNIRHVPIMDDASNLVGLISQTDVIKYQLAEQNDQVRVMKNLNIAKS
ncbi:MAG: CBS domain-containing protein [Rhodospirillaceae bacterium]